jgi:hypothetical protein
MNETKEIHGGIVVSRQQARPLVLEVPGESIYLVINSYFDLESIMNSFTTEECGRINNGERITINKVKDNELSHHHQLLSYIINSNLRRIQEGRK